MKNQNKISAEQFLERYKGINDYYVLYRFANGYDNIDYSSDEVRNYTLWIREKHKIFRELSGINQMSKEYSQKYYEWLVKEAWKERYEKDN